ncbi:hypothetical protein [Amycolatopsis sp. NPDC004378]
MKNIVAATAVLLAASAIGVSLPGSAMASNPGDDTVVGTRDAKTIIIPDTSGIGLKCTHSSGVSTIDVKYSRNGSIFSTEDDVATPYRRTGNVRNSFATVFNNSYGHVVTCSLVR